MKKFYSTMSMMLMAGIAFAAPGQMNGVREIGKIDFNKRAPQIHLAKEMSKKPAQAPALSDVIGNYMWIGYGALENDMNGYAQGDLLIVNDDTDSSIVYLLAFDFVLGQPIQGKYNATNGTLTFPNNQYLGDYSGYPVYFAHYVWNDTGNGINDAGDLVLTVTEDGIECGWDELIGLETTEGYYMMEYANMFTKRPNTLNNEGWIDGGIATVNDLWMQTLAETLSGTPVGSYEVPFQYLAEDHNIIRLVDPYGPNTPYATVNASLAPGSIIFDITEPDAVQVMRAYDLLLGYSADDNGETDYDNPVYVTAGNYSGFMLSDTSIYPGNDEGYFIYEGFTAEDCVLYLDNHTTYENGIITVNDPIWGQSWFIHDAADGFFAQGDLGTPTIILDNSGVEGINVDNANAPVKYFNLQGVEINNPEKGQIVIKRQGNNSSKYIAR